MQTTLTVSEEKVTTMMASVIALPREEKEGWDLKFRECGISNKLWLK
jgi:hypothetical protein